MKILIVLYRKRNRKYVFFFIFLTRVIMLPFQTVTIKECLNDRNGSKEERSEKEKVKIILTTTIL